LAGTTAPIYWSRELPKHRTPTTQPLDATMVLFSREVKLLATVLPSSQVTSQYLYVGELESWETQKQGCHVLQQATNTRLMIKLEQYCTPTHKQAPNFSLVSLSPPPGAIKSKASSAITKGLPCSHDTPSNHHTAKAAISHRTRSSTVWSARIPLYALTALPSVRHPQKGERKEKKRALAPPSVMKRRTADCLCPIHHVPYSRDT
jgi:hypothetical protein